jgi:MFS family permease
MREVFRSLHVRNYRLFAVGQLISLTGTWAQAVGQDWLVLRLTGGDGVALGIALALQFLPMLVLGLYGGVLADRYSKRRILVAAQAFMGVLALALAVLTVTGAVRLWMVYVLAGLLGLATVVDNPTRQAFVSEMVQPDDVPNAVALNSATFNLARIAGPALAGLTIGLVGVAPVFFANAVSYAAVVAGLLAIREADLRPAARVARARGQVRAGVRYVVSHRDLLAAMVLTLVVATFGLNFRVTLALMSEGPFRGGAGTYGLLSAVLAAGAVTGALLSARRRRPRQATLVGAAVAFGLLECALALMPTQPLFLLLLFPTGAMVITFTSTANATVQLGSSDVMRGRVMALYALVFLGGTPLGGPLMGWVAEAVSPRASLALGGVASLSAGLLVGLALLNGPAAAPARATIRRRVRRLMPAALDAPR